MKQFLFRILSGFVQAGTALLVALTLSCLMLLVPHLPVRADVVRSSVSLSPLDDVLACTRTDRWIASLGLRESLRLQLSHRLSGLRPDLTQPVLRALDHELAPESLRERFRGIVAARAEVPAVERVRAFCVGPLGQRYAGADQQVHADDVRAFLAQHPLSGQRRAALERWVEASSAMTRYRTVVVRPAVLLERAMHAFNPDLPGYDEKQLAAPMSSPELLKSAVEHSARALQDFSDAELAALTSFEVSSETRRYRAAELDAVEQVLEEAFAVLTLELEALGGRVRPSKSTTKAGPGW